MTPRKIALMKLMPSEFVDSFLDGNIYMNTPTYFSDLEADDVVRSDFDEGIHFSMQVKELSIQDTKGEWVPIGGLINPVIHRTPEAADYNMFCMYALYDDLDHQVDDRNLAFGDTYAVITNAEEFIKRFKAAAEKAGKVGGYKLVEYVDRETYHGPMGPFRKFSSFSYQNEYRMALQGGDGNPFILKIGDIRDICVTGPSEEINRRLFRMPPPHQSGSSEDLELPAA